MCKTLYRMSRQLANLFVRALFTEWKFYKRDLIVEDAISVCIDGAIFLALYLQTHFVLI